MQQPLRRVDGFAQGHQHAARALAEQRAHAHVEPLGDVAQLVPHRVMPDYERRRDDLRQRGVELAW